MSKLFMFEKPQGMRDTLPELYELKRRIRDTFAKEIAQWGFERVETPSVEFYETVGAASAILDQQLFKLLDHKGNTLVLRPDMTAPIARIAASTLKDADRPLRLTYDAPVFRAQQAEGGRPAEFEQIGVELIGDGSSGADAEVISLMMSSLARAEISSYQVAIGNVGFVNALLKEILGNDHRSQEFRRYLYEKNYVGFRKAVDALPLSSIDKNRLNKLLRLKGDRSVIDEARKLVESQEVQEALDQLEMVMSILADYESDEHVLIDLNLVMHMSYYTGTVFEAYSEGLGYPLGGGGRYDKLLEAFNHDEPATGFGLRLDRLAEAAGRKKQRVMKDSCIIFSQDRRKEAMQAAKKLRETGRSVVMQEIAGIKNVDSYSSQFNDVQYFVGSNGNGGSANE
ncbi:ATP phosphoribosyltransferase regulatory subunit [Paenalkalicoccus suaedae]|uniref:ATP phosphoribosyltransferase regulatory subunit n=1 Tax=Paenalkalicoccus suaedae TaxID=2592382 RepID=A0A859FHW3_9BACI|nr:ATP phosphoribosyltransferase regulatory subunit [Paenalkalicoccus suaedae]QKS72264.1 ATP phosphoribosyltransferase regulatory subunit [Paenalkalicoccus suaedae]